MWLRVHEFTTIIIIISCLLSLPFAFVLRRDPLIYKKKYGKNMFYYFGHK